MTDPLSKLFGRAARVKLLRLFLFNPRQSFTLGDIVRRARVPLSETRKEIRLLSSIGAVERVARGKGIRFGLVYDFPYTEPLQNLLLNAPARGEDIVASIRKLGLMKLIVLSGIFTNVSGDGLDIIIVGDKVQERKLRDHVKRFESELGKELRFTILSSDDFNYRLNMNDKLIRDVFDFPHRILVDKLNIGLK